MNDYQKQTQQFNDLLFKHRNKAYGAYVLRSESDKILTKSMFFGISLLTTLALIPLGQNFLSPTKEVIPDTGMVLVHIDEVNDVIKPEKTVVLPTAPAVKTEDNTVPVPTRDTKNEIKIEKIEGAVPGNINNTVGETAPENTYQPPAVAAGTGEPTVTIPKTVVTETPAEDPDAIIAKVDAQAAFPGGIDAFRKKIMNEFDASNLDTGEVLRTNVSFVVERDGSISNIKADGKDAAFNKEAMRTVKGIKAKWNPAKLKNKPVRSYFTLPISVQFE